MIAADYKLGVDALPFGKRLPGATYLLDPGELSDGLPAKLGIAVAELRSRLGIGLEFNIPKFHATPKISFLAYPGFEKVPHPALEEAVVVDLVTGKVRRDDYRGRENPPILHRKETFVPSCHPLHSKFARLTREEDAAGLLDETSRIGFRLNWEGLLESHHPSITGHRLVKVSSDSPSPRSSTVRIHRHKTALVRRTSDFARRPGNRCALADNPQPSTRASSPAGFRYGRAASLRHSPQSPAKIDRPHQRRSQRLASEYPAGRSAGTPCPALAPPAPN